MRSHLSVEIDGYTFSVEVGCLDAAQIYASQAGFYDLDVDTDERGVKIVASAHKRTLTARGKTLREACQKLVEAINGNG
jgi:hypothetical protein